MERAAAIADDALASVIAAAGPGEADSVTEAFLAARPRPRHAPHSAQKTSAFETIVASGPNSAKPHARPSDRRIGPATRW